jgi:F-type H+-transporting ATPase subunit b
MKTVPCLMLATALTLMPAAAQHEATPAPAPHGDAAPAHGEAKGHEESKSQHHGGMEGWKWANFLLLAAGLGYLIGKNAGPFFATRSREIRQDMEKSEELRRQAEERAAAIERKLAGLQTEIDGLRAEAAAQQEAEARRIEQQIAAEGEKIERHAAQEIESAEKSARGELKRYSAELALELAERRISSSMTRQTEDELLRGFVAELERPTS